MTCDSPGYTGFVKYIYGSNHSECEQAKNVGFLPFILWVILTIYIFVALMKLAMSS
jgi:hypothetical protein